MKTGIKFQILQTTSLVGASDSLCTHNADKIQQQIYFIGIFDNAQLGIMEGTLIRSWTQADRL